MLSKKINDALNSQISEEAQAANLYLSMASWSDTHGLPGSSKFLYTHAEQERQHMMKLFRYVNDAGGHALAPTVNKSAHIFKSLSAVMEQVSENERQVTKSINELVDLCLDCKDYSTFNFLQWYVAEQHEEERLIKSILDLIKITGTDGRGLFLIDKEIGKLADTKSGKN